MKNKRIIIAGGTGFIGQALAKYWGKENLVIIPGRQSGDAHKNSYGQKLLTAADGYNVRYVKWNARDVDQIWSKEIDGSDLVINLTGKSVNCRYHQKQKRLIFDSRTYATKAIGEAIQKAKLPPTLWVNAASSTIYKDTYDKPNDEFTGIISDWKWDNMPYNFIDQLRYRKNRLVSKLFYGKNSNMYKELRFDFSIQVCKRWEKTFLRNKHHLREKLHCVLRLHWAKAASLLPILIFANSD